MSNCTMLAMAFDSNTHTRYMKMTVSCAARTSEKCLLLEVMTTAHSFYTCSSNHSQEPLQLPQHNMFCLPCVIALPNVMQFIWVPNPLCHNTEWSGVLLNLFVPPRLQIVDGSGPGSVNSTHSVLMPTQWWPHFSKLPVSIVLLVNVILE